MAELMVAVLPAATVMDPLVVAVGTRVSVPPVSLYPLLLKVTDCAFVVPLSVTTYWSGVPSAPAKVAALVATVAEVWLQITFGFAPALFQTKFPAVVFQLPLAAVMAAPSPDPVSQVRAAAKAEGAVSVSEIAARSPSNEPRNLRFRCEEAGRGWFFGMGVMVEFRGQKNSEEAMEINLKSITTIPLILQSCDS